ncbi:monooxygenase [Streptomyces cacaoi]|uniref:monooxygenase n=1 Tax=Streptomyces cacaoi TaxID=1898 RepID=UPI002616EDD8|nr:monooxygenase [Streptomyces cacaoi]
MTSFPSTAPSGETGWLVQVDFPSEGPFGAEMAAAYEELAHTITREPGFVWKLWTENPETQEAGGVYVFRTEKDARAYLDKHTARLGAWGVSGIRGRIFRVNPVLSRITRGPHVD